MERVGEITYRRHRPLLIELSGHDYVAESVHSLFVCLSQERNRKSASDVLFSMALEWEISRELSRWSFQVNTIPRGHLL